MGKLGSVLACVFLASNLCGAADMVYVAPNGNDANPGTAAKPLSTIQQAAKSVAGKATPQTIVLREGVYRQSVILQKSKVAPELLITAEKGANGVYKRVVLDGGHGVKPFEAVRGMPGVYRTKWPKTFNFYRCRRTMWEADSRVRYRRMADVRSVVAYPSSYSFQKDGWLYFHTSDNAPPDKHDIGYNISDRRFSILRSNVTVRGLRFHNGQGVSLIGKNITVEDCAAWNHNQIAFYVSARAENATVRNCTGRDLGAGVKSEGKDTIVEGCRFFRIHDAFESHLTTQDASGIQFYHPAQRGIIRKNLVVGFNTGIFVKGVPTKVVIEGNTAVGSGSHGIGIVHWNAESVMQNNIVSDCHGAYIAPWAHGFVPTQVFRDNLLWNIKHEQSVRECLNMPKAAGLGQGVIVGDPRFAALSQDDYRLLPDSPAIRTTGGAAHMGALGVVDAKWADTECPKVSIIAEKPAKLLGRTVEVFFEQDHWHKNAAPIELRETTYEPHDGNVWLLPERKMKLRILAADNATDPAKMKLRYDNGAWSEARPFEPVVQVDVPNGKTQTSVSVQVADAAGNWSEPVTLSGFITADAPKLDGKVATYVNDYGFVVAFKSDVPCFARLDWGKDKDYGQAVEQPASYEYLWSAGDGGEWTTKRIGQKQNHHFAVVAPKVEAGDVIHFRIALDDGFGNIFKTSNATVTVRGKARKIMVSPSGKDVEHVGDQNAPLRTLQFAVDRALPGDRIVLADGLYPEPVSISHGGVKDAPITIEAQNKWGAAIDAGKTRDVLMEVRDAPYLELRGIEFRWFKKFGITFRNSPHLVMDRCFFWNNLFVKGRKTGTGFSARHCPDMTLTGNVFSYMNDAFTLLDSPRFHMERNTAVSMLHRACRLIFSCKDSVFINNSFNFTGNDHLQGLESGDSWASFTCDYNNFAAFVRKGALRRPAPDKDIKRWSGSHWAKQSKGINLVRLVDRPKDHPMNKRVFSLEEWQESSGKDKHSIFKRPMFAAPDNRDFSLQPDSPNIGAGKDGATIGALDAKE
jgi:Right handed beta helix region